MSETRYIISDAAKMIDVEPHVLRYWEEELGMEIPRNEMGHRYYTDKEVKIFSAVRDLKEKGFQLKAIKMVLSAISEQIPGDNIISLDEIRKNIQGDSSKDGQALHKGNTDGKVKEQKEKKNQDSGGTQRTAKEEVLKAHIRENLKELIKSGSAESVMDRQLKDEEKDIAVKEAEQAEAYKEEKEEDKKGEVVAVSCQETPENIKLLSAEEKMQHFKYMMDGIMLQALRKNNDALTEQLVAQISDKVIGEMDDLFRIQEEREEERFKDLDEMIRSKQKGRKEAAASKAGRKDGARRGLFKRQKA